MDWQLAIVVLIVAVATGYLIRQSWRTWSGRKSGCGGGCACDSKKPALEQANGTAALIPSEQITLRRRDS